MALKHIANSKIASNNAKFNVKVQLALIIKIMNSLIATAVQKNVMIGILIISILKVINS